MPKTADQPNPPPEPTFPGARILVVDDEVSIRRTLTQLFTRMGYQATEAASGQEALEQIAAQRFDLVILDIRMPDMDGTEVLRAARPAAPNTVFILLTAHGTLDSAIVAIRHGAFDYLVKPSPVQEIVRAVEAGLAERQRRLSREEPVALLERALTSLKVAGERQGTISSAERFLQAHDVTVDTLRRLAVVRGQPVDLTPTEFEILTYLMRHQDRIVSCREIVAHVHGYELDERDARPLLRAHIHRLRRKLERTPDAPSLIRTVRGSGYLISVAQTPEG
ncbi:MAG: response regulator transcription factor [Anaerolineae bacterium]|nr:response regulator transcription factor [Anaerolineae bacterium]